MIGTYQRQGHNEDHKIENEIYGRVALVEENRIVAVGLEFLERTP